MRKPTPIYTFRHAWAIDPNSGEGHGLLGVFWFGPNITPWQDGQHTALFRTRAIARAWLHERLCLFGCRGDARCSNGQGCRAFPKMKVVRVSITITITDRG